MNNKLHEYLKKAGEEISLTHEEREKMRGVLHAYMAMKPIPSQAPQMSPISGWSMERIFARRAFAASLIAVVFVSTAGISYAAEGALPGDLLYPVKTHVNEPVRGAFAVSPSAKSAWAMSVAGERIKEATMLAAEGRLSPAHQQELQANFESHARKASENISAQASTSPEKSTETAVRFEAQLSEYERVLTQVGEEKKIAVGTLVSSVQAEREHVAKRNGLIAKKRGDSRQSVSSGKNNSEKRARKNAESGGAGEKRVETRPVSSTTTVGIQSQATTSDEFKSSDMQQKGASLQASSSSQSGFGEGGAIDVELHNSIEATQEIKNTVPPVQSVLPVLVPSPTLP
ncbi:MAG: DUF5667 domain-containing protein [Candidatus Kaiserbacteria bacterium]|nr:DUF5667 domain-containing protein [Candidatus Kaiserbacteria bacterium]